MAYPTRATLVAASDEVALTGASATAQDGWYAASKRAVEGFCGQRFDAEIATRVLPGGGGSRLPLDRRLAAITALSIEGSSLDASDVALSEDRDELYVVAGAFGGGNWIERRLRDLPAVGFTLGEGTVSITGTWGWLDAELPATADTAIGIAMRIDMEDQALADQHGLAATVRAQARLGLENIDQGSLRTLVAHNDVPLSPECQRLLEPYVWQPVAARS